VAGIQVKQSKAVRGANILGPALVLLALVLLIPLAVHGLIGSYSRYVADDFCTAGSLRRLGFFSSQVNWYLTWSGRFSFMFTIHTLQLFGTGISRFGTLIVLVVWLSAGLALFSQLLIKAPKRTRLPAATALGAYTVAATLLGAPNLYQSLYWLTGAMTYSLPLALATGYGAWLAARAVDRERRASRVGILLLGFGWTLFTGGFSETMVVVQTSLLGAALLAALVLRADPRWRGLLAPASAGFVGSIAALVLVVSAPGNAVRLGLMTAPSSLPLVLRRTFMDLRIFVSLALRQMGPWLVAGVVLAVFVPVIAGAFERTQQPRAGSAWLPAVLLIPIVTVLLMYASILPYEYALSNYPDGRVLVTTQYLMVLGLMLWGIALGRVLARRFPLLARPSTGWRLAALLLLLAGAGWFAFVSSGEAFGWYPEAREFAQLWDVRDQAARQAVRDGERVVMLRSLSHIGGLSEIAREPGFWVNVCVAQTYGLRQVTAK